MTVAARRIEGQIKQLMSQADSKWNRLAMLDQQFTATAKKLIADAEQAKDVITAQQASETLAAITGEQGTRSNFPTRRLSRPYNDKGTFSLEFVDSPIPPGQWVDLLARVELRKDSRPASPLSWTWQGDNYYELGVF